MIDDFLESKMRQELSRKPGHLTWRLHQKGWRIFSELAAEHDITPVQEAVLLVVSRLPGIDQKTLSALVALDRSTAGSVLMRLEQRKLLTRKADAGDKRARLLRLTPRGEELSKKLLPIAREAASKTLSSLSETEQLEFGRLLRKLAGFSEPPDLVRTPATATHRLAGKNVVVVGVPGELGRVISDALRSEGASVSRPAFPKHPAQEAAWLKLIADVPVGADPDHGIDVFILGRATGSAGTGSDDGGHGGGEPQVIERGQGLSVIARVMAERGQGRIINLGGFQVGDFPAPAAAEEIAGSDTLTAAIASQLAANPRYAGIAINSVNPRHAKPARIADAPGPSLTDIAAVVLFLAADGGSRHITGQTFQIGL